MQESQGFDTHWRSRVSEYEASVATQLCSLKQQHESQLTDLLVRCETERLHRPQHSAEILNGRKIEEALVKQVHEAQFMCGTPVCRQSQVQQLKPPICAVLLPGTLQPQKCGRCCTDV